MRILLIDVNCKFSSTGKIVYDLYHNLVSEGIESSICYGRGPKIEEKNIYKFGIDAETFFHAFMTRITGRTGIFSFFSTWRLIKYIDKFKPDIIHIHELHGYFVNIYTLINYIKSKKIKTVWTFHCEFMYTGKCGLSYDCKKWQYECGKCPQLKVYPKSIFFDFTNKMQNEKKILFKDYNNLIITAPSNWLKTRIEQSFLKEKEIVLIHNGIDTKEVFYPRKFSHIKDIHKLNSEVIFLSVAPDILSEQKGGRWILKLAKYFVNMNVKFILIGIDDLNEKFDNNIIPLGRIYDQKMLAEYYSMSDLTLICSKKETFSLTTVESLACGTPVMGFDSGAPREIAPEGYGKFLPYGDIDCLRDNLNEFLTNKKIFQPKEDCVKFVNDNYSKEKMFYSYREMYYK